MIQKHLEDPFAEEIINSSVEEGDILKADYKEGNDNLIISVLKGGLLEMPDGAKEALEVVRAYTLPVAVDAFSTLNYLIQSHTGKTLLARAIAGDKSDNLPGIPRAGLKTIKNRFPFMGNEEVQTVESLAEFCRNVDKPVKLHENILSGLDLIESNYDIMQLYKPVMGTVAKQKVEFSLNNFEPEWNKIQFQKYLMRDGQITINLDKLFLNFKQIIS